MTMAGCGASSTEKTPIEVAADDPETTAEDAPQDTDSTEATSAGGPDESPLAFDWQGHRGARGLRPENTLPGFELALDLEVDTLEFDLHLAADDVVVVWHDPIVESAKCGDEASSTALRELTSAELGALRCDRNPDPDRFPDQTAEPGAVSGDDYSIKTLSEVFDFVAAYAESTTKTSDQRANAMVVRFNIETKRNPNSPETIGDGFDGTTVGTFEQAIIDAADRAGVTERVTVQSFDHRSVFAIHRTRPDVGLSALSRRDDVPDFDQLVDLGIDVWSPDHRSLTGSLIDDAQEAGLEVVPWTVNDPADMQRLLDEGVDGLITDHPDRKPAGG